MEWRVDGCVDDSIACYHVTCQLLTLLAFAATVTADTAVMQLLVQCHAAIRACNHLLDHLRFARNLL